MEPWSWLLSAWLVVVMWGIASQSSTVRWYAWLAKIVLDIAWCIWAIATAQYGFVVLSVVMIGIDYRGWRNVL